MRIVVIGPTYPLRGGIAQHTTLLVRTLRHEHDVLFISFSRQYPKWLFPGKSDRDPSENPIVEPVERLIDSVNPLTWLRALRRVRRWRPDLVVLPWWVTFWTPLWWVISRGVKRRKRRPTVTFLVHNALPHETRWWDRWLMRLALGAGDRFVAHAETEAAIIRRAFPSKPIVVTPHPTYAPLGSVSAEIPSPKLPHPANKPLLLFAGIIRPYKGLDLLLDALPLLLAEYDLHLAIVGEMWGGEDVYLAQIERLGLVDHVTVENEYVSNERLAAWVKSADIVVLPYRSATQSGIVQLALGLGTPVITTSVGGLSEAVADGVNGLVVEPNSVIALSNGLKRFLSGSVEFVVASQAENADASWERLAAVLATLAPDDV